PVHIDQPDVKCALRLHVLGQRLAAVVCVSHVMPLTFECQCEQLQILCDIVGNHRCIPAPAAPFPFLWCRGYRSGAAEAIATPDGSYRGGLAASAPGPFAAAAR